MKEKQIDERMEGKNGGRKGKRGDGSGDCSNGELRMVR
jgi:hypothetical protein